MIYKDIKMKLFLMLLLCRCFVGMSNFEFCTSASCTACKVGYFGDTCLSKCPNHCHNNECDKVTGLCLSCMEGYFMDKGKSCVNCPDNCKTCESESSCFACINGYKGDYCQNLCSNCKPGTSCDKKTGFCKEKCSDGLSGVFCNIGCSSYCQSCNRQNENVCISCAINKYGNYCRENCSLNCEDNICNDRNGECTIGCLNGFWGGTCENNCSAHCKDYACAKSNGECLNGCIDSYEGIYCNTRIPQLQHIVYVIIGVVVLGVVIFIFAICLWKARRCECCGVKHFTICKNLCLCIKEPQTAVKKEHIRPEDRELLEKSNEDSNSYHVGQDVEVVTYSGENYGENTTQWLPAVITEITSGELIQVKLDDEISRFVRKSQIRMVT